MLLVERPASGEPAALGDSAAATPSDRPAAPSDSASASRDAAPARPIVRDGSPVTVPISAVAGFFEQVGRNTDYIIHPEEILASNFAMLVLGDSGLPSRDVLERMREILEAAGRQQRR
jgi:hypothetical protein